MWRPFSILLSVIAVVAHARGLRNGGLLCSSSINDVIRQCTIATGFTFQAFDPKVLTGLCLNTACRTAAVQIGTLTEGCIVSSRITLRNGDVKKFEHACREDKHLSLRGRQSVLVSTQQPGGNLPISTASEARSASLELPNTVLNPSDASTSDHEPSSLVASSTDTITEAKPKESNQENGNSPIGNNGPLDAPSIAMDPHTPPFLSSNGTHQQTVHSTTMRDAPTKLSFKAIVLIIAIGLVSSLALIGAVYHVYKRHEERSHRKSMDPPALVPITFDKLLSPGTMLAGMVYKQPRSFSNTSTERLECSDVLDDEELLSHRLSVSDVQDVRVIGHGGSGIVYLVKYRQTRLFASKRLIPEALTRHKLIGFITEIKLVATLVHPHIVSFIGVTWTNEMDIQALFEYMPNGNLQNYLTHERQHAIKNTSHSSWTMEKVQMTIDIIQALVHVHTLSPALVHRDLKSSNVLLNEYKRAKLSDFGVSRFQSQDGSMTTGMGTSRWMAPEVLIGGGDYDQSCDIYSFGVLLTELDTHEAPFNDIRTLDTNEHPSNLMLLQMVALGRLIPSFRPCCPRILQELGQQCMSYHRPQRPTANEILHVLQGFKSTFSQEIHL